MNVDNNLKNLICSSDKSFEVFDQVGISREEVLVKVNALNKNEWGMLEFEKEIKGKVNLISVKAKKKEEEFIVDFNTYSEIPLNELEGNTPLTKWGEKLFNERMQLNKNKNKKRNVMTKNKRKIINKSRKNNRTK